MIPLASRRFPGLAHRGPALFLFILLLLPVMTLLSACRSQQQEHQLQGSVLGTGYHLTLYADLDEPQREALKAGIQGELADIEQHGERLLAALGLAFAPYPAWLANAPQSLMDELARLLHAAAVDRLTRHLKAQGMQSALVEVGGMVRTLGAPPGRDWTLSLAHVGLPGSGEAPRVTLRDAALVQRPASRNGSEAPDDRRVLGVSVVAATASEAQRQALWLTTGNGRADVSSHGCQAAEDRAARLVVETPQGIEIHNTTALEPWLVR